MTRMLDNASPAEKMDRIYRRQRFIYDATRRYYLLGRDRMIADLKVPQGGAVLEVGCGTARNLIVAARRYSAARFFGLDVSEAMLQSARASVARCGLEERIVLESGDAAVFDAARLFGVASFDRVFISYCLSMIPCWADVVRHVATYVAPKGKLLLIDFGDFDQYPALVRRAQLAWLRRFSVVPIPLLESQIGTLAEEIDFKATTVKLYGGYAVQASLERP